MKSRVVKKVEKRMLVDKVCELQREICEYNRFMGDLLLMLLTKNPGHKALASEFDFAQDIWTQVIKLMKENAELREKCSGTDFEA